MMVFYLVVCLMAPYTV